MYLWRAVDDEGEILGSDMRPYLDVWTATKFITNLFRWRSGRDSNPRYGFAVYSLSRRAPSTTRPPLRILPWKARI